jgi:hypothetical protein
LASFPAEARPSRYYAARETDAATLRVGSQTEKFLFYRGVATVKLPLSATVSPDGVANVSRDGAQPLGTVVRFDRRDGRLGFEVKSVSGPRTSLGTPPLTGSLDALTGRLEAILSGAGLYPREARAMVETWRDSWFEEGTRLLYILPRADVDALLPLEIKPQPVETARVFVGRMELITPATTAGVKRALETRDRAALMKYGRFLLPIARRRQVAESGARPAQRISRKAPTMIASSAAIASQVVFATWFIGIPRCCLLSAVRREPRVKVGADGAGRSNRRRPS